MGLDYRRCDECGGRVPREIESCPSCGRFDGSLRQLATFGRLLAIGGPALLAWIVVIGMPDGVLGEPGASIVEAGAIGVGLAPLACALLWLVGQRRRRDPRSFAARIEATEARLEELERDLEHTERRILAARRDLDDEKSPRASAVLRRELEHDRRLRAAQRRLIEQLEDRRERLAIERFKAELVYFEACRDAPVDAPAEARALAARIEALRCSLGEHREEAWERVLEDARVLHRQLARGVARLEAARRLDPLAHADLHVDPHAPSDERAADELEDRMELHLERIERGFDAIDELNADLDDPDASGMRLRVDDEVLAALEAELEEAPRELGKRTSVDGL